MDYTNYEVSLWTYEYDSTSAKFVENKLATLGGSHVNGLHKCINPVLKKNVNGCNSFSFSMYTNYMDENGEQVANPFYSLLQNENRIKLRIGGSGYGVTANLGQDDQVMNQDDNTILVYDDIYDNILVDNADIVTWSGTGNNTLSNNYGTNVQWYDFIIKNIELSYDGNKITYECEDAYANELGKTGYNLTFDEDLDYTNEGTATDLATQILADSEWSVDTEKSDIINQYQTESLIEYGTTAATDSITFVQVLDSTKTITLSGAGKYYYGFYSQKDATSGRQFLIINNGEQISDYSTVDINQFEYPPYFIQSGTAVVSGTITGYQGSRLVETTTDRYDTKIKEFYSAYTDTTATPSITLNAFTTVEYITPYLVCNMISIGGFAGKNGATTSIAYSPAHTSETTITSSTRIKYYTWAFSNSGYINYNMYSMAAELAPFAKGKSYVIDIVANQTITGSNYSFSIYNDNTNYFTSTYLSSASYGTKGGISWYHNYFKLTGVVNATEEEVAALSDLNLKITNSGGSSIQVYETSFYPYYVDSTGTSFIKPGDTISDVIKRVYYNFYNPASSYTSKTDLTIIYKYLSNEIPSTLVPVIPTNKYEKIRSIKGSQSNRFNLLQTICETFECWMHFDVQHDTIGRITSKKIYFTEENGTSLGYGFINGVNLQSADRTADSTNLTTKLIVSDNANEYADDGSCSITRSSLNFSGENRIYNFDYYILKGLLDREQFITDFYGGTSSSSTGGYLTQLHTYNSTIETKITELAEWQTALNDCESEISLCKTGKIAAQANCDTYDTEIIQFTGYSYTAIKNEEAKAEPAAWYQNLPKTNTLLNERINKYEQANISLNDFTDRLAAATTQKTTIDGKISTLTSELATAAAQKEAIHNTIAQKYAPFIQEGTWIDENYRDEDLYYLDALNVSSLSAYPEISYSIKVIDLSGLDEFKGYDFNVGDITYVQATDFFGWTDTTYTTPQNIKIYISEQEINLDDPSANSITVQNYENDFESLFQKITATTQTLQYKGGVYNRTSNVVTTSGSITFSSMADTINNNKLKLDKIGAQSIVIDENGITATDASNLNEKLRIVSSGIFVSQDNGATYKAAITGEGINASYIRSGTIDVDKVNLMNGSSVAFRWDENGLSAYSSVGIESTTASPVTVYNQNKFVRFDRFGIYGYNNSAATVQDLFVPSSAQAIWDNSNVTFQVTEKGFKLNEPGNTGRIEIGYGSDSDATHGTVVIAAGRATAATTPPFKVYEDGHFVTTSGAISGDVAIQGGCIVDGTINGGKIVVGTLNKIANQNDDHQVESAWIIDSEGIVMRRYDYDSGQVTTSDVIHITAQKSDSTFNWGLPYIRLGVGDIEETPEQYWNSGIIKKFTQGLWIGNKGEGDGPDYPNWDIDNPPAGKTDWKTGGIAGYYDSAEIWHPGDNGIFICFTDNETYVYRNGECKAIGSGSAVFS